MGKAHLLLQEGGDLGRSRHAEHLLDAVDVSLRRIAGVDFREALQRARLGRVEGHKLIFAAELEEAAQSKLSGFQRLELTEIAAVGRGRSFGASHEAVSVEYLRLPGLLSAGLAPSQ
jgi:hypothetical protein